MSGVRGSKHRVAVYETLPGTREHAYATYRAAWREAFDAWIAAGRPATFAVEAWPPERRP
jgi:hypothetical protein